MASEAAADRETNERLFKFYGYCIGYSPDMYGEPGTYVQSDIQFTIQVVDRIREYLEKFSLDGVLKDEMSMQVETRFFANQGLVASQLRVDFGVEFLKIVEQMEIDKGMDQGDPNLFLSESEIRGQNHGYEYRDMYKQKDAV